MNTIYARDFSNSTADVNRDNWTPDKIQYVIDALNGGEVLIEVDNATGHVMKGRLVGYRSSGSCGGASAAVLVEDEHGQRTYFLLFKVGAIVDLSPNGRAKWEALTLRRRAEAAARVKAAGEAGITAQEMYDRGLSIEVYGIGDRQYDVTIREKDAPSYKALHRSRVTVPA